MTHTALVQAGSVIDTRDVAPGQSPPPPVGCQWVADPSGLVAPGWTWTVNEGFAPPPAPAPTPAKIVAQINSIRDNRLAAGFADTGTGGTGKTYPCDDSSIGRWTAMAAGAQPWALGIAPSGSTAPTFQIIAADNQTGFFLAAAATYALFDGRVMPWVSATVVYARAMKNNILAGQPPNAQNNITQGWP